MTAAVASLLGERITEGVVVTGYGQGVQRLAGGSAVQGIEAGHPLPDENSVRGARRVVDLAQRATARDLFLCLISGGGSALLTLPVPDLDVADLRALTETLLRAGATIHEVNTVRKHLSQVKGGQLARLVAPASCVTLVLSDVVGDALDVIASGPTAPDRSTRADARAVLARYHLSDRAPLLRETPKPGDTLFEGVQHVVVGSNRLAARAAVEEAEGRGYRALLLGTYVEGEAREVGRVTAALAKSVRAQGDPIAPPACLVWGGETTVTVRGEGAGGRNQELALAAALALEGWAGVLLMALATDGVDGPTDAAGALVTGETAAAAREAGLDARAFLARNDSYHFFERAGGLIRTGPTGTNVNDLLVVLVDE
jgi:hydroxypyruvate reductase